VTPALWRIRAKQSVLALVAIATDHRNVELARKLITKRILRSGGCWHTTRTRTPLQ
jgi:hypothetical protein